MQKENVVQMEEGPSSSWGMDTDLWYISLNSLLGTKAPTLLGNGNFSGWAQNSWSTALWPHYQPIREGLYPAAYLPNFASKTLSETPLPPHAPCIVIIAVQSLSHV